MIDASVLNSQQVAALLSRLLGNVRGWSDFLADCAREKDNTNHHGLTLPPLTYVRDRGLRPVYRGSDVARFIRKALELAPRPPADEDFRTFAIELDADSLKLPVKMRRARRRAGRPTS